MSKIDRWDKMSWEERYRLLSADWIKREHENFDLCNENIKLQQRVSVLEANQCQTEEEKTMGEEITLHNEYVKWRSIAEERQQRIDELEKNQCQTEECKATTKMIMEEKCPPDEVHCTCVPFLRKRVDELEGGIKNAYFEGFSDGMSEGSLESGYQMGCTGEDSWQSSEAKQLLEGQEVTGE